MASTPKDPYAKPLLIGGLVLLGGAVVVLVSNLFSTIARNSTVGAADNTLVQKQIAQNLAPVGTVVAVEKAATDTKQAAPAETADAGASTTAEQATAPAQAAAPSHADIDGKKVYKSICFSCHDTGLINAPKLGDKEAWAPRIAQGIETLYTHSLQGLNAMPAKGGNAGLPDEEVKAAVDYMVTQAGGTPGAAEQTQATPPADTTEQTATTESADTTEQAAATESTDTTEQAAATESADTTKQAATTESTDTTEQAAATENTDTAEQTATKVADAAEQTVDPAVDGEKIYRGLCFSCHDAGVLNSPKLGNKEDWAPRIAQGKDTLYNHSLNGLNLMPPKGGNATLTDAEVKAAVDFMVAQSQ